MHRASLNPCLTQLPQLVDVVLPTHNGVTIRKRCNSLETPKSVVKLGPVRVENTGTYSLNYGTSVKHWKNGTGLLHTRMPQRVTPLTRRNGPPYHHPRREPGQLNYPKSVPVTLESCSQLEDTESLASKEHRMMKMI